MTGNRSEREEPGAGVASREGEVAGLVADFLAGYDLGTDIGRFRAYRDAIAHAQENLLGHPFCNLFLDQVGKAVGREPAYLDNLRSRIALPEKARLDFCYEDDWGFVVTGNSQGLEYLAGLLRELAAAPCPLDHLQLPNDERPLGARSYPLTVYKEGDGWFERLEGSNAAGDDWEELPKRDLEADEIYALQFVQFPPPELPLTVNRIYRVHRREPAGGDESAAGNGVVDAGTKPFEGGPENRRFRFEFVGDTRRPVSLVLHVDDPGVNFFTKRELMKVVLDPAS